MKKSELLLDVSNIINYGMSTDLTAEEISEEIVDFLLKKGITPPRNPITLQNKWDVE